MKCKVREESMENRYPPSSIGHNPMLCWLGKTKITEYMVMSVYIKIRKDYIQQFIHEQNIIFSEVLYKFLFNDIDHMMAIVPDLFWFLVKIT